MTISPDDYQDFWNRKPPPPRVLALIRALSSRDWPLLRSIPRIWTPQDPSVYVRNAQINSDSYYFENAFKTQTAEQLSAILKNNALRESHENEIKTRLYRAIHQADILDHLMPVESRAYWFGRERWAKLIICIALSLITYLLILCAPAALYRSFFVEDAIYNTYQGPHSAVVSDPKFVSALKEQLPAETQARIRDASVSRLSLDGMVELLKSLTQIVNRIAPMALENLSDQRTWRLSNEEERKKASLYALFLETIGSNANSIDDHPLRYTIVTTPWTNWLELFTQLMVIIIIWGLLTAYFSRKYELFQIISSCSALKRPLAVMVAISFLEGIFRSRKRFHYLIAAFVATVATCVHFYYVGDFDYRVAHPIAEVAGLTSYDYRFSTEFRPIFIAHWLLQFLLVFTVVLLSWEVGILGDCSRKLQRHIVKKNLYSKKATANKIFRDIVAFQKTSAMFAIVAIAILVVAGILKMLEAKSVGLITARLWPLAGDQLWPLVGGWNSSHARIAYCFSPAVGLTLLLILALRPMYASVEQVQHAIENKQKWDEEDVQFLEAALDQLEGELKVPAKDILEIPDPLDS